MFALQFEMKSTKNIDTAILIKKGLKLLTV